MVQLSMRRSRLTSCFDRPSMRKRPLRRDFVEGKMACVDANIMQSRIPYDMIARWSLFLTLFILYALSLPCTAFHTSFFAIRIQKAPLQRRVKPERKTCQLHVPYVRLFMEQSADDAIEVSGSNATIVSANQSTTPLIVYSSHSNSPLQPSEPPAQQLSRSATTIATPHSTNESLPESSFGDVVSLKQRPVMNNSNRDHAIDTPSFGDVVPLRKKTQALIPEALQAVSSVSNVVGATTISEERKIANQIRFRNTVVAILSIAMAVGNFIYQYLHPIEPIQILFDLQQSSADISVVGKNHKPTVIDFWAPWCENCKLSAATLQSIEKQYGNDVNFILINGDLASNWPYIEALGVDAIPHMSMISYDGVVETALIGPIPKHIIQEDIEVLLLNSRNNAEAIRTISSVDVTPDESSDNRDTLKELNQQQSEHVELPHKMFDAFVGKPESARRLQFE